MSGVGAGQWGSVGRQSPDLNAGFNADYRIAENTVVYVKSTYSRVKRASGSVPSYFRWKLVAPTTLASYRSMQNARSAVVIRTIPGAPGQSQPFSSEHSRRSAPPAPRNLRSPNTRATGGHSRCDGRCRHKFRVCQRPS